MGRVGQYNGVEYRHQRICDVMVAPIKARWYFAYCAGKATSDHFKTLAEFKAWVDSNERD